MAPKSEVWRYFTKINKTYVREKFKLINSNIFKKYVIGYQNILFSYQHQKIRPVFNVLSANNFIDIIRSYVKNMCKSLKTIFK